MVSSSRAVLSVGANTVNDLGDYTIHLLENGAVRVLGIGKIHSSDLACGVSGTSGGVANQAVLPSIGFDATSNGISWNTSNATSLTFSCTRHVTSVTNLALSGTMSNSALVADGWPNGAHSCQMRATGAGGSVTKDVAFVVFR
jgi:hypothetical protein